MSNYKKICSNLLKNLPEKQKKVVSRRFALSSGTSPAGTTKGETLESIGKDFGITRERVRQVENDAFLKLKPEIKKYQSIFESFKKYLKNRGGLEKEEDLLNELGGKKEKKQVYFLLNLNDDFKRFAENNEFYALWFLNKDYLDYAKKAVSSAYNLLLRTKKPLSLKEINQNLSVSQNYLKYYLESSKKILKNSEKLFGLKNWPEINPKGVKDKAYLIFKEKQKPLHFSKVANLIGSALPQTVHNELIKDPRFVLVGRGIYALKEWGYYPGQVKDVIFKILKEEKKTLSKEEILNKVLKQRLVKKNTVFLNLSNKNYFFKNSKGNYAIKEA